MSKNTKKVLIIISIFVFTAFTFKYAFAEIPKFTEEDYNKILEDFYNKATDLAKQKASTFELNLSPEFPEANMEVRANISTFSFNTSRAYITWYINGNVVEQGQGKNSITFRTGGAGTTIYLSVAITTENDINLSDSKEIKIGGLDLLWQADTYTPPLYKGKAMPTKRSPITVVALPQGLGSPSSLIYNWRRDYRNLPGLSGVGKNSLSFYFTDISSEENVSVSISTRDGNELVEKSISIRLKKPEVILYEESPTEGLLFQHALGNSLELMMSEIAFRAEPYYFLKPDLDSLSYSWTMNNEKTEALSAPNTLGLTIQQGSTGGDAEIGLKVENKNKYLERVIKNIKISF